MGHYAKVNNGKVVEVIVAEEDFFKTFVDTSPGEWIKTSYNTRGGVHYKADTVPPEPSEDQSQALRGNYAGIGYTYDAQNDVFYAPQPKKGWVLNKQNWLWEAPVAKPTDGKFYDWDEASLSWKELV